MGIFGSLKKIGKGVLKVGGAIGKRAAPLVGLIPGVGTVAGGAIGGLSSLASDVGSGRKISLGNALKSGATGALSGLAGTKLLGGKGLPGLLSKAGGLIRGGGPPAPPPDQSGILARQVHEAVTAGKISPEAAARIVGSPNFGRSQGSVGGSGGGILETIKNFALKNPAKIAGLGLGVANTISAGKQSGEADAARKVALSRLQTSAPVSLDDTFGGSGNPYATRTPGTSRKTALRALQGTY